MKHLIYIFISIIITTPLITNAKDLNIYLWEDTMSPKIISDWEHQHHDKVNLFHFDNDDERSLLMLKSNQLPFDIIVLDNVSAKIFARQNTFEDLSNLTNRKNIAPRWNKICGTHAIPYFWGSVGIVYRKSKLKHPPKKWSDLSIPLKEYQGHIGMINDSVETLLPVLNTLGLSPVTDNLEELKTAYQIMTKFNKYVLTYEYALSYVRSHSNSDELYMALGYSGDQYSLNRFFHNDEWGFVTPEGASYIWIDCMAVNSNSENKEQAKEFLNYLMRSDVAAQNAMDIGSATPNAKALKILPKSYKNDKGIFVSKKRLKQAIIDQELTPQNLNIRAKIINSLFNQHEAQP
jgi:spermidine/putrescine transport system substrate-binding protein